MKFAMDKAQCHFAVSNLESLKAPLTVDSLPALTSLCISAILCTSTGNSYTYTKFYEVERA